MHHYLLINIHVPKSLLSYQYHSRLLGLCIIIMSEPSLGIHSFCQSAKWWKLDCVTMLAVQLRKFTVITPTCSNEMLCIHGDIMLKSDRLLMSRWEWKVYQAGIGHEINDAICYIKCTPISGTLNHKVCSSNGM